MLAVSFWLHRFTAASLSHTILTDRKLILPDLAITPIAASPIVGPAMFWSLLANCDIPLQTALIHQWLR
jgi:hypothetical protein